MSATSSLVATLLSLSAATTPKNNSQEKALKTALEAALVLLVSPPFAFGSLQLSVSHTTGLPAVHTSGELLQVVSIIKPLLAAQDPTFFITNLVRGDFAVAGTLPAGFSYSQESGHTRKKQTQQLLHISRESRALKDAFDRVFALQARLEQERARTVHIELGCVIAVILLEAGLHIKVL